MPTLADIVATLESGGGQFAYLQPPSMVNPTYGQYRGFVNQYGSGPEGINNYASQVLAANPNATLGDFYSSYVLGTGNPSRLFSPSQLQANYPTAYNNLVANAGYPLSTPLSQFIGGASPAAGGGGQVSGPSSTAFNIFDPSTWLPSLADIADYPAALVTGAVGGNTTPTTAQGPNGPMTAAGAATGAGLNASGLNSVFGGVENWLTNASGSVVFVIIGTILVLGALIIFAEDSGATRQVEQLALVGAK